MPQIDLKNMYLGSYFLANGNNKMYNEEIKNTSMKQYDDFDEAEKDFNSGNLCRGEHFMIQNSIFVVYNDANSFEDLGVIKF